MYKTVDDVDWDKWNPEVRATLLFVIQEGRILLIHKKRGFGRGKINGPGGKIESGETPNTIFYCEKGAYERNGGGRAAMVLDRGIAFRANVGG